MQVKKNKATKKSSKTTKTTKSTVKKAKVTAKKTKKTSVKVTTQAPTPAPATVVMPLQPVVPVKTEAQEMWDEIKNLPIQLFGLPSQTVEHHCTQVVIEPTHLYLTIRASAVLPALETALNEYTSGLDMIAKKFGKVNTVKFTVELADKFVIVSRVKPGLSFMAQRWGLMSSFNEDPKDFVPKSSLKKINGAKSMFDEKPKRPTQQEFEKKVQDSQERQSEYKRRAAELFMQFTKTTSDKTLVQQRNQFTIEAEREMLQNMIQLAIEINNDPNEQEGMGSLTWITCLFKTCLAQRDRINELEYNLDFIKKKLDTNALTDYINKEINKALDKKKSNE